MPPAPASQGSSGAAAPKPACTPQSAPAPINPSSAGRPSRKKAENETITITSISARVATSPASAAAATVIPLADEAPAWAGTAAAGAGSAGDDPVTAAWTSCHECQCAPAVIAPATPADAAAMTTPAARAAALRRSTGTGIQTRRRRTRPRPDSMSRSRSQVVPHRIVNAKQAVIGSSSDARASGERKTKRASGRSATAADTGESRNDHAPPAAPSRGNSMKPSILPIAAQYAVTAATNANTGSRSHGAVSPNRLRNAMPAAIHSVTQTVLAAAPGRTSRQFSVGSLTGV